MGSSKHRELGTVESKLISYEKNLKDVQASMLYLKKSKGGKFLVVSLYVDDLIFTGNNRSMCDEFKNSMMLEFDMSD